MKKFLLSTLALFIAIVMNAAQVNLTWAGQSDWSGVAEKANIISLAADGFTITIEKSSGQTAPTVIASANDCRAYANNVITVSSTTGNMTEIIFNISNNGKKRLTDVTASEGTAVSDIDNQTVTWTGNAAEVTFTVGEDATHGTDGASKAGQICFDSVDVTYTVAAASSVATPTFTVEPGTYGEKKSVGIECATDGAVIYYTLDGTTPDNTSTPYEAAIELNSKTTVKAIAYVGEEASNVASATYDFKLEGSLTFVTAPILASDMQAKIEWTADWANNTVNYLVTYDGTEPTVDNKATTGTGKVRQLPMYTWKKDTAVVISIRPELDGIYGDTFTKTYYIKYAKTLDAYKAVSTMAAGNYVLVGENSVMLPVKPQAESKMYDYGYTVDATVNNGLVSAFGYFEFAFEATDGGYYIKGSNGMYLGASGTYKSFQLSTTAPTTGGVWSVEIQANGQAKITNNTNGYWIQWDSYYKNWALFNSDQSTMMPTLAAKHVPTLEMTPAANATVETLDKIVLTCSDGIAASASVMKYVSVQGKGVTASVTANQVDDNTLEFVLSEPITTAGDYDFVFYKGCVTLGPGSLNQAHPAATEFITYTVGGGATPVELVVTPANESENKSLQHFTFTCEQGISINNLFGGQVPFLGYTDPATGASSQIALTLGTSTETSVTLSTEKVQTTEGIYTLVVPAEYFVLAGTQPNEAIMYQYLVAGGEEEVTDYIFNAEDYEVDAEYTTLTDGIFTFLQGNGSTKPWIFDANEKTFSNGHVATKRIKPQTDKNYLTADVPAAGKLVFGVLSSSGTATDRTLSVKQNDKELYGKVVSDATDKVDGVYTVHEVAVEAGLATITMVGAMNFYYIEFVPAGDTPATIEFLSVTPKEGPVTSLLNIQVVTDTDLGEAKGLTLTDADGKEYSLKAVTNDRVGEDGIYESIIITLDEEITAAGTYTLTIPAGKVVEYIEDMATQTPKLNAEKTYTWTIDANNGLAIVSTTPAEGAEVESFSEMIVEFNKEIWIGNAFTGASAFVVKDANGETATSCLTEIVDPIGSHPAGFGTVQTGTKVRVYADEEVTTAGNYQLIIPANTVKTADDTEVFPETAINFTVAGAANTLAIVKTTPANGETVDYIYEVQVEVSEPVYLDSFNGAQPYLLNADGEKLATFGVDYPNYTGYHQGALGKFYLSKNLLFFLSSPIKDAGNYQIVIPANSFKTDDDAQSLPETIINVTIEAKEALAVVSSENTDKGITIKFNKEIQVVSGLFGGGQFVVYDQWGMNYGACSSVSVNDDKTSLYAEFSETLVPDSYKIVIPDNTVKTADGSETLAATTVNFTVSEAAPVITATWSIEEGTTIEEFESVTVTFAGEGIDAVKATNAYACIWFYEKDANGNYNLVANQCTDGYLDATASGTTLTLGADPGCYSEDWISPFSRKGDYRIVIPAGGVYFNGDKANANTEEYVLNFTIYNEFVELEEIDATFVADPEDNSTISEIKEIVITFPEYETIAVGEPDFMTGSNIPTVSMVDDFTGATMPAGYIMFRAGDAANQLVLYVDPAYTGGMDSYAAEGQYVINIPAKVVTFSDGVNKAFQLNYTVGQVNEELAIVSTTPAEGAEVESFSEMIVEYNKPVWFTSFGNAKLKDAEGTTIATLSHEMLESVGNHTTWNGSTPLAYKVRFYTDNAITTDGDYSVVIENETFATDDASEYSEKATINFSVKYVAPSKLELIATDPAEGSTITNTFEHILTTWNMNVDIAYLGAEAYLLDAEGNRVTTANATYVYDANHTCIDNQLDFIFTDPVSNAVGTYTFVIEAFYVADMETYVKINDEIRIDFILNLTGGIKGIEMDPVHGYVVYDFNGILVMQTRNAADLERLNNGLYIINGVKILINK